MCIITLDRTEMQYSTFKNRNKDHRHEKKNNKLVFSFILQVAVRKKKHIFIITDISLYEFTIRYWLRSNILIFIILQAVMKKNQMKKRHSNQTHFEAVFLLKHKTFASLNVEYEFFWRFACICNFVQRFSRTGEPSTSIDFVSNAEHKFIRKRFEL